MSIDHNIAYYPYSTDVKFAKSGNDYTLKVTLPSEQIYAPKSFGNGSFPMASVSADADLTFKNVCGGIKLQLKGTCKVESIVIEGNNGGAVRYRYISVDDPTIRGYALPDYESKT